MEVLALLRSKNKCLERFLSLSRDYLSRELECGDLSRISTFEQRREATLRAMELYDRKINEALAFETGAEVGKDATWISAAREILDAKQRIVYEILEVDFEIISRIEKEKSRLLREMTANQKSKETLSRFKSEWMPKSGQEIDKTR